MDNEAVFTLTKDSHLVTMIAIINEKCEKAGKPTHSVEYWCEDLLARGINTFTNYLDADKDRRNREAYIKEMAKLTVPNGQDAAAMTRYAQAVQRLSNKFGIGGTQAEV